MAINYVKFQRGNIKAYQALVDNNRIDDNTLYFIYPENSSLGSLYLGKKLISGGDTNLVYSNINDLADVIIENAKANDILVRDANGNWINKTPNEVALLIKDALGGISQGNVYQGEFAANKNHLEAIQEMVGSNAVNDGDIAIIKTIINGNKYQYTAYVYSKSAWVAMDGNYSANTVYFENDLIITKDVGVQKIPEGQGSKVVNTAGKNVKQVFDLMFAERVAPSKINPTATVSCPMAKAYEVGTLIENPSYVATFNQGLYSYGPATGIAPSAWNISLNGQNLTENTGVFNNFVITDSTNMYASAVVTYNASDVIPIDNLGNPIGLEEYTQCKIASGQATAKSGSFTGYRKAFYGSKINKIELNNTNIRELDSVKASNSEIIIEIVEGAKQVVIAVPEGRVVAKVIDTRAFGIDIFDSFIPTTAIVGGADSTQESVGEYSKLYRVYTYTPMTALGNNKYKVILADG